MYLYPCVLIIFMVSMYNIAFNIGRTGPESQLLRSKPDLKVTVIGSELVVSDICVV